VVLAFPIESVPLEMRDHLGSSLSGLNKVEGLRMVNTAEVADLAEPMALYFTVFFRSS
jgi:hypothetical protein